VRLPNKEDRVQLLDHLLKQQYNDLTVHEIHQIGQLTHGYSGSDLANLARDAAYGPIRELRIDEVKSLDPVNLRKVDMSDFLESMKKIKKSVSPDSLVPYEAWNQKFGEGSS
jgi:spastin